MDKKSLRRGVDSEKWKEIERREAPYQIGPKPITIEEYRERNRKIARPLIIGTTFFKRLFKKVNTVNTDDLPHIRRMPRERLEFVEAKKRGRRRTKGSHCLEQNHNLTHLTLEGIRSRTWGTLEELIGKLPNVEFLNLGINVVEIKPELLPEHLTSLSLALDNEAEPETVITLLLALLRKKGRVKKLRLKLNGYWGQKAKG